MEFDKIDIHELLPQKDPFVMVGRLVWFDEEKTVTETLVSEDNIFVDNGFFSASGIIENMAQTCAARIGYVNKYILQKGIQIGFIGAIRGLNLFCRPKTGDLLRTTVTVREEIFGMTLVEAEVKVGDRLVAEAGMKIALRESEDNGSDNDTTR